MNSVPEASEGAGTGRDAETGETVANIDPTTEQETTQVAKGTPKDADDAVRAASRAFEEGPWGRMHHEERAKICFRIADLLDERAEDFAMREAMDMGMPFRDFLTTIMPHCSGLFRFYGGLAIVGGGSDLDTFLTDMQGREQLDLRRDQALQTLGALASATRMGQAQVHGEVPGAARPGSRLTRL